MTGQRGRKRGSGKTKIALDSPWISSGEPEELLFKLNELLYQAQGASLRRNPRIVANLSILWKYGEQIQEGTTYTLSREGMFIKTLAPAELNSEIELSFLLPNHPRLIRTVARVVQKITPEQAQQQGLVSGMAVSFKQLDSEAQKKLDEFIQKQITKLNKRKIWI